MSTEQSLRAKIEGILRIYPRISPSMLQTAIGPNTRPSFWRPVLLEMMEDGIVVEDQIRYRNYLGSFRTALVLHLSNEYVNSEDGSIVQLTREELEAGESESETERVSS